MQRGEGETVVDVTRDLVSLPDASDAGEVLDDLPEGRDWRFEPEWDGHVTIEISNTTPLPARIYSNEGICQVLFLESDEACAVSYKDKKGKYQGQTGITLPRL